MENNLNNQLRDACWNGNLEKVKSLREKGADMNAKSQCGSTLLHWACHSGKLEIAKYLIEKGADVNAKDKEGATPFHYACRYGNLELVKYLVEEHGVDVNAKNRNRTDSEVILKITLRMITKNDKKLFSLKNKLASPLS